MIRTTGRRLGTALIVVAGVALGLAAESAEFDVRDVRGWIVDLGVGWCLIALGLFTARRIQATGVLLMVTGFVWFTGNFWPWALYLHRGPLIHALVAFPGWRPRSKVGGVLIVGGYAIALVTPIWRSDVLSLVVALALLALVSERILGAPRRRRDLPLGLVALVGLLVTVGGSAALRLAASEGQALEPTLLVYEAVLCAIAVRLAWAARAPGVAAVADLVVELAEAPSVSLRDQLAVMVRDPSLQVGFWSLEDGFVDDQGGTVGVPAADGRREVTFVEWESRPYAVIVHDRAVLRDPALVDAVATATRLSAANASLHRAVRSQVDELVESRRRVVSAADVERRRLERRLRDGPGQRLRGLEVQIEMAQSCAEDVSQQHLERAGSHLAQAVVALDGIARGLHPRELSEGLHSALSGQADRSPVPVALAVTEQRFDVEVEAAVYYLCAECLTNVAKHARASRAAIEVRCDDQYLVVAVSDDGIGGAAVNRGSGLRGISDRVEALGGTVRVHSPAAGGTRVVAELPLGHHSS